MKDRELKLVEVNASRTLVQRGRSCPGRGKWRGCKCYLLTDTHSRRISLAGKGRAAKTRNLCACVSEERGRGAVRVCGLPADRYTKLGCCKSNKKKYKYLVILYCLCFFSCNVSKW